MRYVTEFSTDGSVAPLSMGLTKLTAGDTETITLLVNGFQTGDTITSIKLYAKLDITDSDTDVDTIVLTGVLSTPTRDANARQVTFSLPTSTTVRLLTGRVYAVRAIVVRSGVTYTETVMMGFIGAAYPGATAVAPSDEATLRLAGDAAVTSLLHEKVASVTGVVNRITISGTATNPIVDLAATYVGQTSLTTVGTITTGVWHGTQIADSYLATISTAGKVSNSATTATAALTAFAIVARDQFGDFIARDITARTFIPSAGGQLGYYPLKSGEANVVHLEYHYEDVLRWGADPTGTLSSSTAIKNASADIGAGGVLRFTPGGIWKLDTTVYPRYADQEWIGNGSRIKRCNLVQDTITSPITTSGTQTFNVSTPSLWAIGMSVGFAQSGAHHTDTLRLPDTNAHKITAINGNAITVDGGASSVSIPTGAILYSSFVMVTAGNTYSSDRFKFRGFVVDGNATSNTLANRWEIHTSLSFSANDTLISDVYVVDAQADGIIWGGLRPKMLNVFVYNAQGNGVHLSATTNWQALNVHVVNANLGGVSVGHADGGFIFSNTITRGTLTQLYVENAISTMGSIDSDDNSDVQFNMIYGKDCTSSFLEMQLPALLAGKVTLTNWRANNCVEFTLNESQNTGTFPTTEGVYQVQISAGIATTTKLTIVRANGVAFDTCTFDYTGNTTSTLANLTQCRDVAFSDTCLFIGGLQGMAIGGLCQNVSVMAKFRDQNSYAVSTQGLTAGSTGVVIAHAQIANSTTASSSYIGLKLGNGSRAHGCHLDIAKGQLGMELLSSVIVDANVIRTPAACPSIRLYGSGQSINNYVRGNWAVQAIQDLSAAGTNVVSENMPLDVTPTLDIVATTVTATTFTGALTGNASTATALQTARTINGTSFNGTANVTVTADATTLTGASLAANVLASSLTSVGVLAAPHMTTAVVDSGGLTVNTSGALTLNGAAATTRVLAFTTAGLARWQVLAGSGAESGGSAGSNFFINAYTDAGSLIDSPVTISRVAGGGVIIARPIAFTGGEVTVSANPLTISGAAATNRHLQFATTGGNVRWQITTNNTAESGSNAGSDFEIHAYTDGVVSIDIPIAIARVAGGPITLARPLLTIASATARAGARFPHGAAPTSPVDGDFWTTTAGAFLRVNGVTKSVNLT